MTRRHKARPWQRIPS